MNMLTLSLSLSLAVGAVSAPALAQNQPGLAPQPQTVVPPGGRTEPETLTSQGRAPSIHLTGWFVAPTIATTSFGDTLAYSPGLRGGVLLNGAFAVGVAVNGLGTEASSFAKNDVRNVGLYGGLLLQYTLHANSLIHVGAETTIGSGKWCHVIDDGANGGGDGCHGRRFLAFEPAANVELNVARHVRVTTGVGYRFAAAASGDGPSSSEMSGIVARTALVFGSF